MVRRRRTRVMTAGDEAFMRRALALAKRGARANPNPRVGCVLVQGERVVGSGFHAVFGGPHAEARALAAAGRRARGATAYVNLEPCCRLPGKKTPPCCEALAAAGVRRVVAGTLDPNPHVAGKGLAALRRAGVRTAHGVLEAACRDLNRAFEVRMREGRPYVVLKVAASLDGRIASACGRSRWITSPRARRLARRMRAEADAVLAGIGTVLADDPALTSHGLGKDPLRVVLDSRLRVPSRAKVLDGKAPTLIATMASPSPADRRRLRNAMILRLPGKDGVDLRRLLARLAELGVGTLLVEGGGAVHTAFLEAGLVDELRLFLAPKLLGGRLAPSFLEGRGAKDPGHAPRLSDMRVRRIGPDLLLTGRL